MTAKTISSLITFVICLTPLPAQNLPNAPRKESFEVAAIKPSGAIRNANAVSGWSFSHTPTGLKAIGSLRTFIKYAYGVDYVQISGGPVWLDRDIFEIDAKAAAPVSLDELRLMLQSLLADRFSLAMHRETRQMPIYSLIVAKSGSRLQRPDDTATGFSSGMTFLRGAMDTSALAGHLTEILRRTVIDNTGLNGTWKFELKWAPDGGVAGASIFTAIQEQLGLKLEATKGPVEVLVIDRAARPTEN